MEPKEKDPPTVSSLSFLPLDKVWHCELYKWHPLNVFTEQEKWMNLKLRVSK